MNKIITSNKVLGLLSKCPRLVTHSIFPVDLPLSGELSHLVTSVECGGALLVLT